MLGRAWLQDSVAPQCDSSRRPRGRGQRPDRPGDTGRLAEELAFRPDATDALVRRLAGGWTPAVPGLAVPGRIVTPRGQAGLAAEAVRISPAILARLENYFGLPYPYSKLDQVAVPEFLFGGMENAGLITYRANILLADQRIAFT